MSTNVQPTDFAMRTEKAEGATVVVLTGEFDIAAVPSAIKELRALVTHGKGPVLLDVRGLTYIDSSGLGVIASTRAALVQDGRNLFPVGSHGIFQKALRLTQLDRELVCFPTMEDALRHVGADGRAE